MPRTNDNVLTTEALEIALRDVDGTSITTIDVKGPLYGAKGDEVTDDTSPIQAAINRSQSGGSVFLPPGTYNITGLSVPVGGSIHLIGSGQGYTYLNFTPSSGTALTITNCINFTVEELTIIHNSTFSGTPARGTATGIFLNSSSNGSSTHLGAIRNVRVVTFANGLIAGRAPIGGGADPSVSEMTYDNLQFVNCGTGATIRGNQSLNHHFVGGGASGANGTDVGYSIEDDATDIHFENLSISNVENAIQVPENSNLGSRLIVHVENLTTEGLKKFFKTSAARTGPMYLSFRNNLMNGANSVGGGGDESAVLISAHDFNAVFENNYIYPDVKIQLVTSSGTGVVKFLNNSKSVGSAQPLYTTSGSTIYVSEEGTAYENSVGNFTTVRDNYIPNKLGIRVTSAPTQNFHLGDGNIQVDAAASENVTNKLRLGGQTNGRIEMSFGINDAGKRCRITSEDHNTAAAPLDLNPLGGDVTVGQTNAARFFVSTYTVATLPAATTAAGIIYVSDETGGAVLAFSDGTNWRRVTDRAVVS